MLFYTLGESSMSVTSNYSTQATFASLKHAACIDDDYIEAEVHAPTQSALERFPTEPSLSEEDTKTMNTFLQFVQSDLLPIKSFECPIYLDTFTNPVMDECGHTFEWEAIMEIYRLSIQNKVPFRCPLDRTKILDVDRIVKNYNLAGAQTEVDSCIEQYQIYRKTTIKKIQEYALEIEKSQKDFAALQEKCRQENLERKQEHKAFEALLVKYEKKLEDFKPLVQETVKVIDKSLEILDENSKMRDRVVIQQKRQENLKFMSLFDKLTLFVWPNHIETVSNRNITQAQRKSFQQPLISVSNIAAQRQELESVRSKWQDYK